MKSQLKKSFNKSYLTVEDQISKLKSLGMLFHDEEKAINQ
jgi:hypothetical protein